MPALAAPLPARMIGWLLGFPDADWPRLKHWSETTIVAGGGLRYVTHEAAVAAGEFGEAVWPWPPNAARARPTTW